MNNAAWYSQSFPPEGASAAEGIRNQLGRPELDLLTVLVRESAQNSWDARLPNRTVDYRIDYQTVSAAHAPVWRDELLREAPQTEHLPLRASVSAPTITILTISDRGTSGLGGPTRADSAVTQDHDFVSFVRNIGEPRDTALGGGTYGFGKGIFYLIAKSGTVLVHTRCRVKEGFETRLIGCALWQSHVKGKGAKAIRYTGRHWWGNNRGEVVEPLTGPEAEVMAHRLGLRAFEADETGTSIVVIDPELGDRDPHEATGYLADTILWNLWPKMLPDAAGRLPMTFSVRHQGTDVPVPDPRTTRPIDIFVEAYENMCSSDKGHQIESYKPKRVLGRLGLEKRLALPLEPTAAATGMGIEKAVHHVCLMRTAELVVTYHQGPKPPAEYMSYAGVFRVTADMDATFAASEPPTHDAWAWQSLEGHDKTFVKVAFTRLKEKLDALVEINDKVKSPGAEVPLGAASRQFSNLVTGSWGIGGGVRFGKPKSGTNQATPDEGEDFEWEADERETFTAGPLSGDPIPMPDTPSWGSGQQPRDHGVLDDRTDARPEMTSQEERPGWQSLAGTLPAARPPQAPAARPKVQYVSEPYYESRDGQVVLVQEFRLPVVGVQQVSPQLSILLPGNGVRETDPPIGAARPEFFGWENAHGSLDRTNTLVVSGGPDIWRLLVVPAPDTVTEIGVAVKRAEVAR
ncbi:hypothetical protein [Lentzea sp. CC55]|uniref:hypothetical protein n=1 Tax=Lentzea sp. CC55 TaxID=2884909 RepID=UPI001F3E014E|nr:hypothetical protein [Lentzea sp. CC55]MCG8926143.1 hypothetical protein [Lentzea sp. CC55]